MPHYTPLCPDRHRQLKVRPRQSYLSVADRPLVPVTLGELPHIVGQVPLVIWQRGGEGSLATDTLVAVTGLSSKRSDFIDGQGQWLGYYLPAVVRQYPFRLAPARGDGTGTVEVDVGSPCVATDEGISLFADDGQESPHLRDIRRFLSVLDAELKATDAACTSLRTAGLLHPLRLNERGTVGLHHQLWTIDKTQLEALDDASLASALRDQALLLAHALLLSGVNGRTLGMLRRFHASRTATEQNTPAKRPQPASASSVPADLVGSDDRFDPERAFDKR